MFGLPIPISAIHGNPQLEKQTIAETKPAHSQELAAELSAARNTAKSDR